MSSYKAGGEYLSQLFVTIGKRVFGDYELYQTNNDFATGEEVMEKQQIENAFNYGQFDLGMEAEEYYNETFKSE